MTLTALNASDCAGFVEALGWIFEHSPWVAERAWSRRPFTSRDALHRAMVVELQAASREDQLALFCAHPDLGSKARMSDASVGEQAGAGLDQLTRDEFWQLKALTDEYRKRFGYPFLLAVKGRTKHDVLTALERRVNGNPEDEWREALVQVSRIAAFRLADTVE